MTNRSWVVVEICRILVSSSCDSDEQDHEEPCSTAQERSERDCLIPPFCTPPEDGERLDCDDLQWIFQALSSYEDTQRGEIVSIREYE
jgi:hypothetical protein